MTEDTRLILEAMEIQRAILLEIHMTLLAVVEEMLRATRVLMMSDD